MSSDVVQLIPNNALCVDASAIAERLRDVADRIVDGEFGDVERVVILMDTTSGIVRRAYGRPTSVLELLGILEYAKHDVIMPPIGAR